MRRFVSVTFVVMAVGLGGCVVRTAGGVSTMPGGEEPVPVGGEQVGGGGGPGDRIEAGCSFNGSQLQGEPGAEFEVDCPANCAAEGATWGTDVYTLDSGICRAGIHAGAIPPSGGVVQVRLEAGRPAYRGSTRHGVQSYDYGGYRMSFAVLNAGPTAAEPVAASPEVIEAGCSYNGSQISGEIGTHVLVSCPSGCADQGGTWGSDVYTLDSGVCRAAIHAGIIPAAGGEVAVTIEPGRPAYRGSTRHGVQSWDYGTYQKSFRVARP